jgi:uncharacterized protein (DUF433 family)
VHSSSEILGGTPVVRGTRIPVYDVAASAAAGISTERILAAYPGLDAEKIELATIFAQANPPRGRPRTAGGELPTGAVIVSDHRRDTTSVVIIEMVESNPMQLLGSRIGCLAPVDARSTFEEKAPIYQRVSHN